MKAFRNWLKQKGYDRRSDDDLRGEKAWRGALNWWLGEGRGGNIRFKDVDYRIELIEKELEGE